MIGFNIPYLTGNELSNIAGAYSNAQLAGDGIYTKRCSAWLKESLGVHRALLTHSCTAALEMSATLLDIQPDDEVIMPSYTFVSTANAFVLRGAVPVFVDIRRDTLNMDENLIESAITERTKAIVPVHYAGVSCEMDRILEIAKTRNLFVIEDAAQGIMSTYKGRALGSIGDLGCLSFHETKNVIAGEGGSLLINNPNFELRAEIIREKGTNRTQFFSGKVDKYSWVDIGSSYLPGELIAAFLWAQLNEARNITDRRLKIWNTYHESFSDLERKGFLQRPFVPENCQANGHMYYLILNSQTERDRFIQQLGSHGINCVTHYVPLHSSIAGLKYGKSASALPLTTDLSGRLVRLPLWLGIEKHQEEIIEVVKNFFKH